ncbi:unnamed protein product [Schistocephalus solidus]|uniref:C2H2-type domain-containing protein n=1 Tax=Schistocephalus solidus TaxID=70667 RepID=A0A183TMT8_SCHSO|nr:unnamed protein product [Schistocephalus solidus]
MPARVTDNRTVSEAFAVTNGVEQGCVLAPTLLSLMFSAMLIDAYRDEHPGSASPRELTGTFSTVGDTLKKSLKQLQINSATWEDLTQDRPAWRRSVKTGSAIYEANRIAAAKAKRAARKSPVPRTNTANAQALPTCPRCQRIFRARIGRVRHLRTQCTNNPTIPISKSNSANPPSNSPTLTLGINSTTPIIIETTSIYSSPVTPTTATTTAFAFTTTTTTTISDGESLLSCTQCDRTFTTCIGLVSHLRIHRTETGEPVPGAPSHSRDRRLHCPHCPRAFTYRMGLFGHMRIHDSGIHHNADNTDTPCTPSDPAILSASDHPNSMNDIHPASTDFSCPHCAHNFNSRIGLVGHLRIHRTGLVNQCLGLRHTVNALDFTALTAPAHLHTAWAY